MKKLSTYKMASAGLMAALMCILGPISIVLPFTPIPISLTNFVIYFCVFLLGWKLGIISYLIYLLLGLVGLPVFSGFAGGAGKLFGPTGGYLIGFIFMTIICGIFMERFPTKWYMKFLGMALGTIAAYLFGTVWLAYQAGMGFAAALGAGVLPFIPGDLAKIVIVLLAAPAVKVRLEKAGLAK